MQAMTDGGFREVETMNRVLSEQMNVMLSHRRGEACSSVTLSENEIQSESSIPDSISRLRDRDNLESAVVSDGNNGRTLTRTRSSSHLKQSQTKSNNHAKRRSVTHKPKMDDQCPVCLRYIKSK